MLQDNIPEIKVEVRAVGSQFGKEKSCCRELSVLMF